MVDQREPATMSRGRAPGIAALLSGILPGLGQAWLGARRRGLLIALPLVAAVAAVAIAIALDPVGMLDAIVKPGGLVVVLVVLFGVAVYHLSAIADAFRLGARLPRPTPATATEPVFDVGGSAARRRPSARRSPILLVVLAVVIAFYGVIEFVGIRAYEAANAIFVKPGSSFEIPTASFGTGPGTTPSGPMTEPPAPTASSVPVPEWAQDGRLNLLLIGSDAGPGRILLRTDTMVVLSVDVASGRAALFGIPRNLLNVPLPPESAGAFANGRYPGLLNSLYVYAVQHPKEFPGGDAAGFRAVSGAIQELIGQPLDGAIVVNLNGFVDLVDAIGGLWVDVPASLYDAHYPKPDGTGYITISIKAGCQHMDGERALEYARSRHQDSDYGRMRRQQRVLLALSHQLDPLAMLAQVPKLLDIAQDNLYTTIDQGEIADLAALAARVRGKDIQTISIAPPTYPEYLRTAEIKQIRNLVANVFVAPAASPSPTPDTTPKPCPRT
jgi:LCP family protein required for cell wall assembly